MKRMLTDNWPQVGLGGAAIGLCVIGIWAVTTDQAFGSSLLMLSSLCAFPLLFSERRLQTKRLLAVVLPLAAVFYAVSLFLTSEVRLILQVLSVGAIFVVLQWPARFGLIGQHGSAERADLVVRRAADWLKDEANVDPEAAQDLARGLERSHFPTTEPYWATAALIYRVGLLDRARIITGSDTPPTAYQVAGIAFWRAGLGQAFIRSTVRPDAWDENVALRACWDAFYEAVPSGPDDDSSELERWQAEGRDVLTTCRAAPIHNPTAIMLREVMVEIMTAELGTTGRRASGSTSNVEPDLLLELRRLFVAFDGAADLAASDRAESTERSAR